MKINQPVKNTEVDYPDHYNILSTTDLKGAISYCNDDFVKVSGFSTEELVGHNHNIVRHPDMPPAAFADLWSTVKGEKPWMGIVKNRCKDGSYYWVDAYVTPIKDTQGVHEYQSVRSKPERKLVQRAEKIYRQLMRGKIPLALRLPRIATGVKLFAGFSLALAPPLTALILGGAAGSLATWTIVALSTGVAAVTTTLVSGRVAASSRVARKVINNPLMQLVYTNSTDDIGESALAIKMQASELRAVVGRVSDSSLKLKQSAEALSGTIEDTNIRVHEQQAETDQVATALHEMSATVQEVARNAALAAESTFEARQSAEDGQRVVNETIACNRDVAGGVEQAAAVINRLNTDADSISTVVEVIRGIAEQTNLLALNAAIEAARAGEQGRGFAVVADEVRTLAQRTQHSTQEIQDMVERLQDGSNQAVEAMEQSRNKTEASVERATRAGGMLNDITRAIGVINDMNAQIATASEEQSAVAEEINRNVVKIRDVAQANADEACRTNEISQQLSDEARRQQQLVDQFQRRG